VAYVTKVPQHKLKKNMAIVQLEGLGKLKKIHPIGTRSRNLPACTFFLFGL
jgi:hypothetical protein